MSETYSFFYNSNKTNFQDQYIITEGHHRFLPIWHTNYDEDTHFQYIQVGAVELSKRGVVPTIKVISKVNSGYGDEQEDYCLAHFAHSKVEYQNGFSTSLHFLLKMMVEHHPSYKDSSVGTIFTEANLRIMRA